MCCFSMCSCESFEFLSFLNGNGEISDGSDDITIDDSEEETDEPDNSEDEESGSPEDSETDETDENGGNWTAGMPLN